MLGGTGILDPVTTTSCTGAAASSVAAAGAAACWAWASARNRQANTANAVPMSASRVRVMAVSPSEFGSKLSLLGYYGFVSTRLQTVDRSLLARDDIAVGSAR